MAADERAELSFCSNRWTFGSRDPELQANRDILLTCGVSPVLSHPSHLDPKPPLLFLPKSIFIDSSALSRVESLAETEQLKLQADGKSHSSSPWFYSKTQPMWKTSFFHVFSAFRGKSVVSSCVKATSSGRRTNNSRHVSAFSFNLFFSFFLQSEICQKPTKYIQNCPFGESNKKITKVHT